MEGVHGVDVSWTHHQGDKTHAKPRPIPKPKATQLPSPPPSPKPHNGDDDADGNDTTPSHAQQIPQKAGLMRRPGVRSRASQEKLAQQSPETPPKRPGWISSLSSKFGSSSKGVPTTGTSPSHATPVPPQNSAPIKEEVDHGMQPYVPQQPEAGSFFSSALRRLSTANTSSSSTAKAPGKGGVCPRQVLNVDESRERCRIKELTPSKLRRVAFSVDVEVAGGSQYTPQRAATASGKDATTEKKLKERGEGEALKQPQQAVENKQEESATKAEAAAPAPEKSADSKLASPPQSPSADKASSPAGRSRPADRPTTDPVRMYRRCCQLREAPVLKRISEQLSQPSRCALEREGTVGQLDLRGSRMQLQDIVCLGDWLAIVPVKKLLLDNANLTDEGLRYILAGLLSAKPPGARKRKRGPSNPSEAQPQQPYHTPGVIEKLTLKNNVKITITGWKYICTFLNMSRSIKAIDVSMIPFPSLDAGDVDSVDSDRSKPRSHATELLTVDLAQLFFKALSERTSDGQLRELTMSECGLKTRDVRKIVDAATISGLDILGLAKNNLDHEGIRHAVRMIRSKTCKGLDLGGNDLRDAIPILADAIGQNVDNPLWGVSIADCNLEPSSLQPLFAAIAPLPNFRFIDLSHNHELFSSTPNAQGVLRKWLPQLKWLRRIHLNDVAMSPSQAIGLVEILPEVRNVNHVSLLDNPQLKELAESPDPKVQEDACALYTSLMVATRLSKTLFAIEIESPSEKSNEVVQAIHKQLNVYSLRNIERFTSVDATNAQDPAALLPEYSEADDALVLPDVLMHLVGPSKQQQLLSQDGDADLVPDEDYLVGGTGVVKALSYCLNEKDKSVRSGLSTPTHPADSEAGKAEAKEMSKSLLGTARRIRTRLQTAMARELASGEDIAYRRLQFLDHTLQGIIERFEVEYPACRLKSENEHPLPLYPLNTTVPSTAPPDARSRSNSAASETAEAKTTAIEDDDDDDDDSTGRRSLAFALHASSRRASETSLAGKALAREEGSMHRFGQRVRRDLLPPKGTTDHLHGTSTQDPAEEQHLQLLREKLEQLAGDEVRDKVISQGLEATFQEWDGLARSASRASVG